MPTAKQKRAEVRLSEADWQTLLDLVSGALLIAQYTECVDRDANYTRIHDELTRAIKAAKAASGKAAS